MRGAAALVLVLALASRAGAGDPVPLGPCGPVRRLHDQVELPISRLHRVGGTPIAHLGLLAAHHGTLQPIPFQVDERRGRKLALPEGPEPTDDDKPGVLDADDLLVFMACDAGEAQSADEVMHALAGAGAVAAWRQIEVHDPVDDTTGFAYLVAADAPPTTDRRYVAYTPAGDLVTTARYRVGLVRALPSYLALSPGGVPGANLIDGIRLRAEATLRADLAHWTLNEQQGQHELIAWKTGPVRVVRRSRHRVSIGLGINLTAGVAHTYFYAQHVFAPGSMRLPFSPSVFFRDITAMGGADGRDLRGWRYRAPGAPANGFRVDGHMDETERRFDSSADWFALTHDEQGLLFVARLSENLAQAVQLHLVYRDDAEHPLPPETSPGTVPLVGYEGQHLERLTGGRYEFQLGIYELTGYGPGDERRVLQQAGTSLTADVTAEQTLSGPGARAADPAAPR